ncbi:MAG TPA: diguanylate cyclase [Candidatus Competibacteraceae bacterium]|nr:diguanylate cyclase [Candidatus Competibacteraceae bacterium]HPF60096.1 diguanylate cyclase [Candidatus Competibacteraceae bacterium]HRY19514.1 diguanylate cyclase [Candidatus Competibacteraceae bacterium]
MFDEPQATILVVDDVIENIEILNNILSSCYRVLFATNGPDALAIVREQSPDLILLDVVMPDMNGYQVCARLKQHPITREIPVIFVTAKDQEEDEETGLQLGAVDYLTKPVRSSIVKLRVGIHLELKRYRDYLAALSMTDGLTGIPNRRRFDEFLKTEWLHAVRSRTPLSLVLTDVDHFKAYNDHYGHIAGDQCLKTVAQTLAKGLTRRTDLVARYGGEEFACVLPATDHAGALAIAERLRKHVMSQHLDHARSPTHLFVTVSMGVATLESDQHVDPQALIERADQQLYRAKQMGRNQIAGNQ